MTSSLLLMFIFAGIILFFLNPVRVDPDGECIDVFVPRQRTGLGCSGFLIILMIVVAMFGLMFSALASM
ncbi:MAG: hypothetical protein GFH27_549281n92 [Chloroflexi bacterium AL-W]|nr:hypothetical protein [Chloroflexi bacterium AL-N1]NOK65978.1 hypothetical protein [Chloroflexi bacterium AL-N10]NOK72859.1 hypothetical protein [Chloroflexi bacterium AL-N5]NOK79756.1 hypothetical protein [Chloroflexi bacterium AL-W]NOK88388.1 hypothetical protein [Chloroflexi bacterium AL-N15]